MRIARALKKIEVDKQAKKSGITKNQFIADAIEFYLDYQESLEKGTNHITQKEFDKWKHEFREEMYAMLRTELWRAHSAYPVPTGGQINQIPYRPTEEKPDDTIVDLVSDWD